MICTEIQKNYDLFGVQKSIQITKLPIDKVKEYENHIFGIKDDVEMKLLTESIAQEGLLHPIIVREREYGYETLSGHRRKKACIECGYREIDAVIVDVDDETANLILIMTNLASRSILPSERAKSYLLRYNDLKGRRNSTGWNLEDNKIDEIMEHEFGESKSKIYMYLHLNYLSKQLLDLLDNKVLNLKVATKISYLRKHEQAIVYEMIFEKELFKLTMKKARQLKEKSKQKELSRDDIWDILAGDLIDEKTVLFFSNEEILKFQSKFKSTEHMKKAIIEFLEKYEEIE